MSDNILDLNKKLAELVADKGNDIKEISIKEFFPDLPKKISDLIEKDNVKRAEMIKWIENETLGSQFNAVRICNVPDPNNPKLRPPEYDDTICEAYKVCPLYMNKTTPVGCKCPLEKFKVSKLTSELVDELEIDVLSDYTDKYIIGELITYSLIEDRAVRGLACMNLGLTTLTLGKGTKEYKKSKSYYLEVIELMRKAKTDLRKNLIATRDEKVKLKQAKKVETNQEKINKAYAALEKRQNIGLFIDIDEDGDNNE